jgi:hypothetical protein
MQSILERYKIQKEQFNDNKMFQPIVAAMKNLQRYDIKVKTITITQQKFDELRTSPAMMNVFSPQSPQYDMQRIGTIWGSNLEIGSDCKVTSDIQFGNRSIPINFNKFDMTFIFKSDLSIIVKSRTDLCYKAEKNEFVAVESLREIISETEFRKYVKYGFILVKGKSGDTYQVFRNKSHTKIWRNGNVVEEICVRLKDVNIPKTDNVIAFKTMIETNEDEFKKLGNVYKMRKAA